MKSKIALVLLGVFTLVVFNLSFFSIFESMSATRWICWAAIHGSFALFVAAAHSTKSMGVGQIHSYPKMGSAFSLFMIMAVVGIVLTIWNPASWKVPVVILTVLAFGDLFTYISLMSAEEATAADVRQGARHRFFIQSCAERLDDARRSQSDAAVRKQLEKAYDAIRGAQVASIPAAAAIEAHIESLVARLCGAVEAGSTEDIAAAASEIVAAVRKRDMEIRLSH